MAKGKKKSVSSGGQHKKHGPKKKMFHFYSKSIRIEMSKLGMLKKDVDPEAKAQSVDAKGGRRKIKEGSH